MWNLLQAFKQRKKGLVTIGTALLMVAFIFPHGIKAKDFAAEYSSIVPQMKAGIHDVTNYDHHIILLNQSWVYEIDFISSLLKKKKMKVTILDFDKRDSGIYDYVIKNAYPEFTYISMRHNQRETHDVLSAIGTSDVVYIIENSDLPPRMSVAIREHMKHAFARLEIVKIVQFDREVDIIGVSREGIELMRKNKVGIRL